MALVFVRPADEADTGRVQGLPDRFCFDRDAK